jgi:hypothetical protein
MVKIIPINLPRRIRQLEVFRKRVPIDVGTRLEEQAKDPILKKSKELVPVDTGALKDTGKVHKIRKRGVHTRHVNITYGGRSEKLNVNVRYAVIQHEGNFRHPRGGQRKFLEVPFNTYARGPTVGTALNKAISPGPRLLK